MWMENKRCRLADVEEILAEMDLSDVEDDIAETDDDMQLVISGVIVRITDLHLELREGVICVWDEDEKVFMPDFDVTVVFEESGQSGNSEVSTEWIYFEQDGMVITLANWLNDRMSVEMIEQLWCEIIIPEQENNR